MRLCFALVVLLFAASLVHALVHDLTSADFDGKTEKGVWFVKFYAPWCGHCKHLAPVWEDFASQLQIKGSKVNIAHVNCEAEGSVCSKLSIRGYPSLLLFNDGQFVAEYENARNIEEMESFVTSILTPKKSSGHVQVLTDKDFDVKTVNTKDVWFVKFYAPWCGHCKHLEPVWDELAKQLEGTNVHIAKVDCTTESELASRFGIQGFPTLKVLTNNQVYEYEGYRVLDSLKGFVQGGYTAAKASPKPKKGMGNMLLQILSNPLYVFLIALVLVLVIVFCVAIIICCITDDEVPVKKGQGKLETTTDAANTATPATVSDAKKDAKQD